VLCIQDTSDVNLYNHKNRIRKDDYIGTTNAKIGGLGFHIHPGFVIDAESFMPYGFSTIMIWNRSHEQAKKEATHRKRMLPIEGKESYSWIETSLKSKEVLQTAREIIIIQDREGDIYEQFAIVPDPKTHLLIRAKTNRTLPGEQKLFDYLSSQPLQGSYQVKVEGDKRRNTQKRIATIEVRFSPVTINSHQYIDKRHPEKINLYAIEAREVGEDIANPIHWRLLTTQKVEDLPRALLCIEWYTCRCQEMDQGNGKKFQTVLSLPEAGWHLCPYHHRHFVCTRLNLVLWTLNKYFVASFLPKLLNSFVWRKAI